MDPYASKRDRIAARMKAAEGGVGLNKDTSNLFRQRAGSAPAGIDVRDFNRVLQVNPEDGWVEVEGMTPYSDLVDATLAQGVMPCVVPQLRSITIGGAVSGLGIEASSFRHGLVHETVLEMEVLLASGDVVTCTPDNDYSDLFHGLPNSYGTLGYILKLRAQTLPVSGFVRLRHHRHDNPADYFADLEAKCRSDADFVDGVIFSPDELYVTEAHHVREAGLISDYTYLDIFYRSIQIKREDYLTTHDFLWRWDTDWFWCSKNLGMQNPLLRRLAGRKRLNSLTYTKIMRWNAQRGWTDRLDRLRGLHSESVIQDICIPVDRAVEFLEFLDTEIGIYPIWTCPARHHANRPTPLFPMNEPDVLYVDFGFWDVIKTRAAHTAGYFNRLIERKTAELGGAKSLYSEAFYDRDEFWSIYNEPHYRELKRKYDPQGRLRDLYEKCVMRA
jgi:FAD/FMN-containing dehydrogenase